MIRRRAVSLHRSPRKESRDNGATAGARHASRVRRAMRSRAVHALDPRRLRGCRTVVGRIEQKRNYPCRRFREEHGAMSKQDTEIEWLKAHVNCAALLGAAAAGLAARPSAKQPPQPEIPP